MTTKQLHRDRLVISVRAPGVVRVACTTCGAADLVVTDVVDDMLRAVKAFIGDHAACVFD